MNAFKRHGPTLVDIEDQIARITVRRTNSTETILLDVQERSSILKKHNELIASQFFDAVAKDLTNSTSWSAMHINQMVQKTTSEIRVEMDAFENGVTQGFDGFVKDALENIEKIRDEIVLENDHNGTVKQVALGADVINAFLKDTKQMYLFYTKYLTNVLENKLQNTTDRVHLFLHSQHNFVAAKTTDRINLCYNVVTQNTKASRLLKALVDTTNDIDTTVELVNSLEPILEGDEGHYRKVVTEATLSLEHMMQSTQQTLNALLTDDLCYLGSAVRKVAEEEHGTFKRLAMRRLTAAVESLHAKWDAMTTNFEVIRPEQRKLVTNVVNAALEKLANEARSRVIFDDVAWTNFERIRSSLIVEFDKIAAEVNGVFRKSQEFVSESMLEYLRSSVERRMTQISALSIQNFVPEDVCPLAMNYQAYIAFTMNAAMLRGVPDAIMDNLFATGDKSAKRIDEPRTHSRKSDSSSASEEENPGVLVISMNEESPNSKEVEELGSGELAVEASFGRKEIAQSWVNFIRAVLGAQFGNTEELANKKKNV